MASKFGFGDLKYTVNSGIGLPGKQTRLLGGRLVPVGAFDVDYEDYEYEFGEVVEVIRDTNNAYIVKPVNEETIEDSLLAVLMADNAAGTHVEERLIRKGRRNNALSLYVLIKDNHGAISVPFGDEDAEIGDEVGVGTGQEGTIQGAVYLAETAGTIKIKDFYIKGKPSTPTVTDAKAVSIGGLL